MIFYSQTLLKTNTFDPCISKISIFSELQQQKFKTSYGDNCILENDMEQQGGRRTMFQLDSGKLVFPGSDYTEVSL